MMTNRESWAAPAYLALLAAIGFGSYWLLGPGRGHFSSYQPLNDSWLYAPAALALASIPLALLRLLLPGTVGLWAQSAASLAVFAVLLQDPFGALALAAVQLALFQADRALPLNRRVNAFFLLFGLLYILVPVALMFLARESFLSKFGLITVFREAFILRTFSWIVFRRVYERRDFGSAAEFLEFFFSPAFFLMPNLLNLVGFGYFHERKAAPSAVRLRTAFLMGLWGLALMFAYSWFRLHYFDSRLAPYLWQRGIRLDHWFLLGGFLSFVLIVVHHTAAMAFQVSLSRILGHDLRYDMIYPFLSRSPMELWRREHNYTRQFLIDNAMRPITIFLLRRRFSKLTAFSLSAIFAYGVMTVALLGWKPFGQENSPTASLGMVLFFTLTIFIPLLVWAGSANLQNRSRLLRILVGLEPLTPLRQWTALDYSLCLLTLLVVSLAKAGIGSLRLLFS